MNSQYLYLFLLCIKFILNSNLSLLMRRCIASTVSPSSAHLRTPLVHKCCQRGGVHQRQAAGGHEPIKRQEPRTTYGWCVPLVPRQGAMRANPYVLQTLWNKIIVKNISPMHYNIITKLVKYIKLIVHTYLSLFCDEACSMLVVPKELKQGELEVPAHHLIVQQYQYVRPHA
jgi:hypothetical protein